MSFEILNRYTNTVIYTYAQDYLSNADLSGANLRVANLRVANLSGAKQMVIRIQGSRHEINAIDGDVRIGCHRHAIDEWLETYRSVGKGARYTDKQIVEYGLHLRHISAILALGVAGSK